MLVNRGVILRPKGERSRSLGTKMLKSFFAHILVTNGSIYLKLKPDWSSAHCAHIVEYILPAKMFHFNVSTWPRAYLLIQRLVDGDIILRFADFRLIHCLRPIASWRPWGCLIIGPKRATCIFAFRDCWWTNFRDQYYTDRGLGPHSSMCLRCFEVMVYCVSAGRPRPVRK